jgi:hypothetical protein
MFHFFHVQKQNIVKKTNFKPLDIIEECGAMLTDFSESDFRLCLQAGKGVEVRVQKRDVST